MLPELRLSMTTEEVRRGDAAACPDALVWFQSMVWFGLVGFSLNASLEPQPRARRRARLAEDAPARNAFWTGWNNPRIPDPTPGPHVRLNAGWSLADDVAVLRPGCPLGDGDLPNPFVIVDAYDFYKRG